MAVSVPEEFNSEKSSAPSSLESPLKLQENDPAVLLELKNTFLRLAAHELRRPLALIRGYLSMLQDRSYGELSELGLDALRQVDLGSAEIEKLAESLATIARLEDHAEVLKSTSCHLSELVQMAIEVVEPLAATAQIEIQTKLLSPSLELRADPDMLRTALVNLLENAVKYSPPGTTVSIRTSQPAKDKLLMVIADQGQGMSLSDQACLFQPWQRGTEEGTSGLGLGLYLVHQIVQLHGGRLLLYSAPGEGSTFTMELPV